MPVSDTNRINKVTHAKALSYLELFPVSWGLWEGAGRLPAASLEPVWLEKSRWWPWEDIAGEQRVLRNMELENGRTSGTFTAASFFSRKLARSWNRHGQALDGMQEA